METVASPTLVSSVTMFSVFSLSRYGDSKKDSPQHGQSCPSGTTGKYHSALFAEAMRQYKLSCEECSGPGLKCTGGRAGSQRTRNKCRRCVRSDQPCTWEVKIMPGAPRKNTQPLLPRSGVLESIKLTQSTTPYSPTFITDDMGSIWHWQYDGESYFRDTDGGLWPLPCCRPRGDEAGLPRRWRAAGYSPTHSTTVGVDRELNRLRLLCH